MTKWILAAGAAALAITSPVLADRGGGHGGGRGGGQAASPDRGGGGAARADRGGGGNRAVRADRGGGGNRAFRAEQGGGNRMFRADRGGGGNRAFRAERGGGNHFARAERNGGNRMVRVDRGGGNRVARMDRGGGGNRIARADRGHENRVARVDRGGNRESRSIQRFAGRGDDNRQSRAFRGRGFDNGARFNGRDFDRFAKSRDVDGRSFVRIDNDRTLRAVRLSDNRFDRRFAGLGLFDGCPPGLARKNNGCLPPGQSRNAWGNNVWGLGAVLPATYYGERFVPTYYRDYDRSFFGDFLLDDDDNYYRYGNGNVYRVDRDYNIVNGLIPLLGGGYSIGQPYPLGYGVYNVPYQYRSYYADDDDYYYRYGDGGIYQVDRSTGVIAAIVSLLAGGLSVGQPLPLGYDVYNMPYAYRSTYYDTPDDWYRYNDGYVYRVSPRTRIVQEVILV